MSTWPHDDLPAPGRFSLARVVAARLGHARRRSMVQMQGRDAWPARENAPEMAVYDPTEDDGEPLTWRESVRFWALACAPTVVAVAGFALIVWMFKP